MTADHVQEGLFALDREVKVIDPHTGVAIPTGRFSGRDATPTERASGEAVEKREFVPLRKGSVGHQVLAVFAESTRTMTSYEASYLAAGDYHSRRREATRLVTRGLLVKEGTLPNPAPAGRPHVDAYRVTPAGKAEYDRLEAVPEKRREIPPDAVCVCGWQLEQHFPVLPEGCTGFRDRDGESA